MAMDKMCKSYIRLSPNEVENQIKNERKKWRTIRLQQVRAQSKEASLNILKKVNKTEQDEEGKLRNKVYEDWLNKNQEQLKLLEEDYAKNLSEFGDAHKKAETERGAMERLLHKKHESDLRASERGREAFRVLGKVKVESKDKEEEALRKRMALINKEKNRAGKVAKLPTPPRFKPPKKCPVKPKRVKFYEAGTHATSSYVPTSVKVVRENREDEMSAKEDAKRENAQLELAQTIQRLKEEENEKKAREREAAALKKLKTRQMYSRLMTQLEEADENHELSEFLEGSRSNEDEIDTASRDRSNRERLAEERVKRILEKEKEKERQYMQVDDNDNDVLSYLYDKEKTEDQDQVHDEDVSSPVEEEQNENETEDGVDHVTSDQDAVHFKETVPIHKIPFVHEKFLRERDTPEQVPQPSQCSLVSASSSEPSGTEGSTSRMSTEAEVTEVRVKIGFENDSTENGTPGTSCTESIMPSSEEKEMMETYSRLLKQKLKEHEMALSSFPRSGLLPSVQSSSGQLPSVQPSSRQLPSVQPSSGTSHSSSSSTVYFGVPKDSTLEEDQATHDVWDNIDQIRASRQRIARIIGDLKADQCHDQRRGDIDAKRMPKERTAERTPEENEFRRVPKERISEREDQRIPKKGLAERTTKEREFRRIRKERPTERTPEETDFQTCQTPPIIYTEPLKGEGSGERPRSKRQKFEDVKKVLLHHYVQRLLQMKQEELMQVTASTVTSSGIDISESKLSKLLPGEKTTSSPASFSTTGESSAGSGSRYDDIDAIPTKLSSIGSSGGLKRPPAYPSTSTPASASSSTLQQESITGGSSSVEGGPEKREILLRMLQLQRMKQQLILQQQKVIQQDSELTGDSTQNGTISAKASRPIHQGTKESSLEWSSLNTYQTPSREDSSQSLNRGPRSARSLPGYRPPSQVAAETERVPTNLEQGVHPTATSSQTSNGDSHLSALKDALQRLTVSRSSQHLSTTSSSSPTTDEGSSGVGAERGPREKSTSGSSSTVSIPDMTQILHNFGLGWAMSMIKKMDIAEENESSDNSKL